MKCSGFLAILLATEVLLMGTSYARYRHAPELERDFRRAQVSFQIGVPVTISLSGKVFSSPFSRVTSVLSVSPW
jgi:hypothetical protein